MSVRNVFVFSDPFYASSTWNQDILAGFRDAAEKSREEIRLQMCNMDAVFQQELDPDVPVVLTNSSLHNLSTAIQELRKRGIPVLLSGVDGAPFGPNISSVTSDRTQAMTRMVQYLQYHGKKRIALVGFWPSSKNDMAYLDAAVSASRQFGCPILPEHCFLWERLVSESMEAFLEKHGDFDAVICPNDTIAICLARACRERQIRIPQELFITGSSNMRISQEFEPSITTISMDFLEIGKETYFAWKHLLDHRGKCRCVRMSIMAQIIPRDSTACLPLPEEAGIPGPEGGGNMAPENSFFTDPMVNALIRFEDCLSNWDEVDQKIIMAILQGKSYEQMEEMLFLSSSAIRYRRKRIFRDAGVSGRAEFEKLLTELYAI